MNSWHRQTADANTLLARTGVPRRVLSRLFTAAKLGVGSSVLDVGCQCGELARYLDSLGIQCTGIDESPHNVAEAVQSNMHGEFHCASINDALPNLRTEFDLIVVRESSAFRKTMLSRAAFASTLQLLPNLRPGGCLAFLARRGADPSIQEGHHASCFARHLGLLPGAPEHHEIPDMPRLVSRVRALVAGQPGAGYGIALLRVPRKPLTRVEWSLAVDAATRSGDLPCCGWAAQLVETVAVRRRAA